MIVRARLGTMTFKSGKVRALGGVALVSRSEPICLIVYSVSHTYMNYQMAEEKKRAKLLQLE